MKTKEAKQEFINKWSSIFTGGMSEVIKIDLEKDLDFIIHTIEEKTIDANSIQIIALKYTIDALKKIKEDRIFDNQAKYSYDLLQFEISIKENFLYDLEQKRTKI